jgi:hypothetical protein
MCEQMRALVLPLPCRGEMQGCCGRTLPVPSARLEREAVVAAARAERGAHVRKEWLWCSRPLVCRRFSDTRWARELSLRRDAQPVGHPASQGCARALAAGAPRDPTRPAIGETEAAVRAREDAQDAELVRVAAYAGLRRGERRASVARHRLRASQDHRPPIAFRRDRAAIDQGLTSARSSFPRPGRSRPLAAEPSRRVHRSG